MTDPSSTFVGRPLPRADARAKVTGAARYGADHRVPDAVHAWLVTSPVARGRIVEIDTAAAGRMPGVLLVLTHATAHGAIAPVPSVARRGPMTFSEPPLGSDQVHFAGQIVALVVAQTLEQARAAALAVHVDCESAPATAGMDSPGASVIPAEALGDTQISHGDAQQAWRVAPAKVHQRYDTPAQHQNPMELFQATCAWDGERLTVWESSQNTRAYQHGLARQLGMPPEHIRVLCPFVGGAFGSRGQLAHYTALVAHAARLVGRPVRLVVTRRQGFTVRTFRAETRHDVKLAANADGHLQALSHESWELTSRVDHFAVAGSESTARLYACPNIRTEVHNVLADRQMPGFMRAPPELPYLFALESAMDELAHELGLDPIELRRRNDTQVDPVRGVRYSSRSLMPCFDLGAREFGWARRRAQPGTLHEGDWLVGFGCASAMYPAKIGPADCRVTLLAPDRARVEIGTNDIGNGSYTILAQVAADVLGLAPDAIEVVLGDSALPAAPITAGSNSTASTCNAVAAACRELRARLDAPDPPKLPLRVDHTQLAPGIGGEGGGIDKLRRGLPVLGGGVMESALRFAFGAQFVQLRVHRVTGEVRVDHLLGAFACGRIVNPLTARSQLMAGQIWGMSSALLEATEVDEQRACYVNHDLAEYHLPVNADVPRVTTLLVPEQDREVNPLGIKGVGEVGATGVNAAVANAVFNATGVRVRSLPIRLDRLLA